MEIKIVNESFKNIWNDYVYSHPDAIAWQCYEWSAVVRKHFDMVFYPLAALEDGKVVGVLPLYKMNNMLVSVAHAVAGGILATDKTVEKSLLEKAIEILDHENLKKIVFKQYKKKIEGALSIDENYYNKELDLTGTFENIRNNFDQRNKSFLESINEAEYSIDFSAENLHVFYKMLLNFTHRNGVPCDSEKWLRDLIECKMYKIGILKRGNKILAGTLIKEFKTTISFPYSCSARNDNKSKENIYTLYWLLLKKYKADGFTIFHSGRIPKTNEVDFYRLGWGGYPYPYYYQYYPETSTPAEFTAKRGLKRKIFGMIWKILPKAIIKGLNTRIIAKFP